LLLRELISSTDQNSDEWNQLQNSKQVIETVLSSLNSERHARDNSDKILEIQKALDPSGEVNLSFLIFIFIFIFIIIIIIIII